MAEAVVDAPLLDVLSLFGEIDLFKDWFPNVTSTTVINQVSNYKGLYRCQQTMPWPLWPRDMVFKVTGMFDEKTNSCICVLKSEKEGQMFFGVPAPATLDGHVRIDIQRGYHYFQYVNQKQTRYVSIFNCDPQVGFVPSWFMNFMMTKIVYQMLVLIQDKSKKVKGSIYEERIKQRESFYKPVQDLMDKLA